VAAVRGQSRENTRSPGSGRLEARRRTAARAGRVAGALLAFSTVDYERRDPMAKPKKPEGTQRDGLDFERPIQELEQRIAELERLSATSGIDLSGEIDRLKARYAETIAETFSGLTPWQRVAVARHPQRPVSFDFVSGMLDDFYELHGDRAFGDDKAILTGFGRIGRERFLLVGHRKGKSTKEKIASNFGSAHPEGYRKAMAKMRLAEKFSLPVVSLINTPGAYPGIGAEERGQAYAIAQNILDMIELRVPILCIVTGEGGSGGALGIGVGDRVGMLEHAYYSVISPEGCAAILWKSAEMAPQAAEALKLTSRDLLSLGVIDEIIAEPPGGAHRDPKWMCRVLGEAIVRHLRELKSMETGELLERRFQKYRNMARP
jgi:acetyl-CoA carboxylase carboxyl transferase subunit alpha